MSLRKVGWNGRVLLSKAFLMAALSLAASFAPAAFAQAEFLVGQSGTLTGPMD